MSYIITEAKIFPCTQSIELAQKIANAYGAELGNVITSTYSDGEFQPSYEESIRGTRIFIIGSTNPGPENLMEMLLMIDAANVLRQDILQPYYLILDGQGKTEKTNPESLLQQNL